MIHKLLLIAFMTTSLAADGGVRASRPLRSGVSPDRVAAERGRSADAGETPALQRLSKGDVVRGFRTAAVYLNDAGHPMGARFVHRRSGFTLDLLRMESVPQAFTWVNSFPVSDQGEPHTQEHLLVGKGRTGRAFAALDTMWLADSSAFTEQWRTCYDFNTAAGGEIFFKLLDAQLGALLKPDYSDAEIRREVRNFGVTENPDHTLRLEEKGSVYNEMTSSMNNPYSQLFRRAGQLVYGEHHPLSYNSGGEPSGIRTMKPADIRAFHDANYYLGNMGSIVALPPSIALGDALSRIDGILTRLQGNTPARATMRSSDFPKPAAAPPGTISFAEYPNQNPQQPGPIMFAWPATRDLDLTEQLTLSLFFDNIARDSTSNLYKKFIDSKTRTIDIGAKRVSNVVSDDPGSGVLVYFTDVTAPNMTEPRLIEARQAVVDEIARVAALPDGSPELAQFNKRLEGRVTDLHRQLSKFVNSPPGFGFRNTGSDWMNQLRHLERTADFRKSVTLKPQIAELQRLVHGKQNYWRGALQRWGITGVTPYIVATKASSDLIKRNDAERIARGDAEAQRLAAQYGAADAQAAIRRYRDEDQAVEARIEAEAKSVTPVAFVDKPPMTIDDELHYATTKVGPAVPMVASSFENMTSATAGIAFRLDALAAGDLPYLALMPALLTQVGVIENGKPVSFDEMTERLRNEILSLNASYSTNTLTGRVELVVRGAGNDPAEANRAIGWMRLVLEHPNWRPENLPRIRDLVDQSLAGFRNTMQQPEERWVNNPAEAYRRQDSALLMATNSVLTRSHNALRLRWLLKDVAPGDRQAITDYLNALAGAAKGKSRADVKALVAAKDDAYARLPEGAKSIAADALHDLDATLVEIPDSSLAGDWERVVTEMRDGLLTPPAEVLAALDGVRRRILHAPNARLFEVGASANLQALGQPIAAMTGALDPVALPASSAGSERIIEARLRQRGAIGDAPAFVGLLAPNMTGGVIITVVPGTKYGDAADHEKQLDFLASRLYSGSGAHSIFTKTINAGLAYSNGLGGSLAGGTRRYYAERTPELPQTVRFVIGELKSAAPDPTLTEYAIAQIFNHIRTADTYEDRAEAMAADLADGVTADQVRSFRRSILKLRKDPQLVKELWARKDRVYSQVLPGYEANWKPVAGGTYFVIGPDKQLNAWEEYLKSFGGSLVRLYPRDFWM
jgi:Zn-dependent M16 (insulinase) family peptidase